MALSISAAVLLGIIVVVLVKGGYVRVGSALACTLFGFTLAATGLAPDHQQRPLLARRTDLQPLTTPPSTAGQGCS
ncbi:MULTISPECIES: hypothetical protein [Streptomyces]|uniref:Uncharacterized protein n=1 Tax=Streptomyces rochei TaxID=1928 RepID=A0ABW7DT60_STRRO|nr:hypothetical protein [Streptomyces sp. TOR3209]